MSKCGECKYVTKLRFCGVKIGFLYEKYDIKTSSDCRYARYCKSFQKKKYTRNKNCKIKSSNKNF